MSAAIPAVRCHLCSLGILSFKEKNHPHLFLNLTLYYYKRIIHLKCQYEYVLIV